MRALAALSALAAATILAGPAAGARPEAQEPSIPYQRYVLDNGLEVLLHEDHTLPKVAVSVWYHVGALNERPGRSGFAHLFEHMMFQGSAHVGDEQHFRILQDAGASMVNGSTGFDRTNYVETVPANRLETALWLEADRMGFLLPTLTQEKLDRQKDVVKNERRETTETQPYGLADERLWQALFPEPHPYHGSVIGSMEDLSAATLEDVKAFFLDWYAPSNATLAIGGDFDPAAAKALVARYFGTLPKRPRPEPPAVAEVALDHEIVIRHEETVAEQPKVAMAWHAPPIFQPGDAEGRILGDILSSGVSSRLHRRLVRELGLAQSVSAGAYSLGAQSVFLVEVVGRAGADVERLRQEMDAILDEVRTTPPSADEVRRQVDAYETGVLSDLQSLGGFSGRLEYLQRYDHYLGEPGFLARDLARFRAVTPASITAFVRRRLDPHRRVVLFAVPKAPEPETPEKPLAMEDAR